MATGLIRTERDQVSRPAHRVSSRIAAWAPYVLAVVFALWSLRGAGGGNLVDTDAARHAMNGAFVHDLIVSGQAAHPVEYGKAYYGRLPALSLPYHPPLFPALEALFFFAFGVSLWSARLAVALAAGVCVVLLYRLVRSTHGSDALAACVTVSMFSLWNSQLVATEVMLEYPALAFTLAALWCVRDLERGYPLGRALWFAVFGAAAVWTKQFAVFLGMVPPLYVIVTGRWRLLFTRSMLISSAVFGGAVLVLTRLSAPFHWTGVNQIPKAPQDIRWVALRNLDYYGRLIGDEMLGLPGLFAICAAAALAWAVHKGAWRDLRLGLYAVWTAAVILVVLVVGSCSERYFFFFSPAILTIGYVSLWRGGSLIFGEHRAWRAPAAFATAWVIAGLLFHPEFLRGPSEAAAVVVQGAARRVLYCGDADGNFVFAVRSLDPKMQTTVIPGEKLPAEIFTADAFEQFCRRYGINWVVLEKTSQQGKWWDLQNAPTPSMKLERSIPLDSSRTRWHGSVQVYRFTSAGARPDGGLEIPVRRIHGKIEVKL
jgi:hypothetical protein